MECDTVSQVQHPSKQAVSANCRLSTVIPLHLSIALAAASAHGCARVRVRASKCTREREHKVQKNMLIQKHGRQRVHVQTQAADASKYTGTLAHMHAHTLHSSSACWWSSAPAKKFSMTKNGRHCDQSPDIYSLVAQSRPDAYSCVCATAWSQRQQLFPRLSPFNKERLVCENAAEHLTLGRLLWQPQKPGDPQTNSQAAARLLKPTSAASRALAGIQHVSLHTHVRDGEGWRVISSAAHLHLRLSEGRFESLPLAQIGIRFAFFGGMF